MRPTNPFIRTRSVLTTLALLVALAPSGGAVTGAVEASACVITYSLGPPPKVKVDCLPDSREADAKFTVEPQTKGADVLVDWNFDHDTPNVTAFRILRGAQPDAMSQVDLVPETARSYVDEGAVLSAHALWYRLEAVDASGEVLYVSEPAATHIVLET